jgi:hypothetical protein
MRTLLSIALIVAALLVGVWDVIAVSRGQPRDTVSDTLYAWSARFPILPLAVGIIIGHVFWPMVTQRSEP